MIVHRGHREQCIIVVECVSFRRLREIDLSPFDRFLFEEGVAFVWESWLAGALRTSLLLTIRQTSKAQLLTVGGQEGYC